MDNLETQFLTASRQGDLDTINLCLTSGVNVNTADEIGHTALMLAAWRGHANIVKTLLAVDGIDVNATTIDHDITALMFAALRSNVDSVKALLAVDGINLNATDRDGDTALARAAWMSSRDVVAAFLAADGIDVNIADKSGCSALVLSVWREDPVKIALLLDAGAERTPAFEKAFEESRLKWKDIPLKNTAK